MKSITKEDIASYKFGNVVCIGDFIRAYDFMPRDGVVDSYLEGVVEDFVEINGSYFFEVRVVNMSETSKREVGDLSYVPVQLRFIDYDERIEIKELY